MCWQEQAGACLCFALANSKHNLELLSYSELRRLPKSFMWPMIRARGLVFAPLIVTQNVLLAVAGFRLPPAK